MSYTLIKLGEKEYKFEMTLQAIKDVERRLGASFLELVAPKNGSFSMETVATLLWFGLQKNHKNDGLNEADILEAIPFKGIAKITTDILAQIGGSEEEGKDATPSEMHERLVAASIPPALGEKKESPSPYPKPSTKHTKQV